ncbi:hypothetical protein CBM2599_A180008 [Cupriavidus taiwanensis]|nr:hypothetical protein CBM2599_A180008 [Cupriavidus taiwanensis]SOY86616.1 hypothetical protein CBM2600_A160008 [Cupriavidus taiwanensis]SPA38701.1 hypothetical protein CBM2606_A160008 [Cupriavidus taiwanensis]
MRRLSPLARLRERGDNIRSISLMGWP